MQLLHQLVSFVLASVGLCIILSCASSLCDSLDICAFNVQMFGDSKANDPTIMNILAKIFSRYDICLIQEIRDRDSSSINHLLSLINKEKPGYEVVTSARSGRTNSKEQYGFIYNKDAVVVKDKFDFPDHELDEFEREPFVVRFQSRNARAPVRDFFIIGIHTKPDKAHEEMEALVRVYEHASEYFRMEEGIIMGDLNAAGGYFTKKERGQNRLVNDDRFQWLIDHDADTNVGKKNCAYDRIIVAGDRLIEHSQNAEPWRYDLEFGIDSEMVKRISDHYPVHFIVNDPTEKKANKKGRVSPKRPRSKQVLVSEEKAPQRDKKTRGGATEPKPKPKPKPTKTKTGGRRKTSGKNSDPEWKPGMETDQDSDSE